MTGRLTVPFYTGGEVQARVRQAKQTHIQRLQEIEQARTETQAQVVTAWAQLQAAQAAVESDQTAVNANRIALAGVREEERVGQRTLLDVLNAEQELLNAEVNLVTDQRNVVVASYTVLSTIGRLNAQDLGVAALVYDAEAHYHDVRRKWFDINITHSDGRREVLEATPPPGHRPGEIARRGRLADRPSAAVRRPPSARCGVARWCSAHASAIESWGRQCVSHAVSDRVLGDRDAGRGMGVRCGMSKPDATGAKSLEEILASIRKSLSGDGRRRFERAAGRARRCRRRRVPSRPPPAGGRR